MKRLISTSSLAAVVIALGAIAVAPSAQAHSDVTFSIGIQVPGLYVEAAPVYVQPRMQPRTFYAPAPVYYQRDDRGRGYDRQHWQRRGPYGNFDRGYSRHPWQQTRLSGPYGDFDRDGIVNRHDSDLDGDGVRNRYDRRPVNPYRR